MPNTEAEVRKAVEPVVQAQQDPFDAYGVARMLNLKYAPMEIGRALDRLAREGQLLPMGEAPEGSLAERYSLANGATLFRTTPERP